MRIYVRSTHNTGYVVKGKDALRLMAILDKAQLVMEGGYGPDRTYTKVKQDHPGWDVFNSKIITDEEEIKSIAAMRNDKALIQSELFKLQHEDRLRKKKLKENREKRAARKAAKKS